MSSTEVHFKAPLGSSVKILTVVAYCILLGVAGGAAWTLQLGPIPRMAGFVALATVAAIGLASLAFRIHGYLLSSDRLLIRYGFSGRSVSLSELKAVEINRDVFRGAWRVFASGGLWSFLGRFYSSQLGSFVAYVSDPARSILITTINSRLVVSPEDPAGFVSELKRRVPQLA